jgi:hypothetical protein
MTRGCLGAVGRVRAERPRIRMVNHSGRGRSALANGHGGEAPRGSVDSGLGQFASRRAGTAPGGNDAAVPYAATGSGAPCAGTFTPERISAPVTIAPTAKIAAAHQNAVT